MKFVVYEVKRIRREEKDDYVDAFLYADYADAVVKFNELVEEEKKLIGSKRHLQIKLVNCLIPLIIGGFMLSMILMTMCLKLSLNPERYFKIRKMLTLS